MAREKSQILLLQSQYLQTRQNQYLEQLYQKLIELGLFVQRASPEVNQDRNSVLDVATSICLRLMTKGAPVHSPSAYFKKALFYMNKQSFVDSLDEQDFEAPDESQSYDSYITNLIESSGIDSASEVGELVSKTLESGLLLDKVAKHLDPNTAQEYSQQMKEVRSYVKESMQGSRMYKTC